MSYRLYLVFPILFFVCRMSLAQTSFDYTELPDLRPVDKTGWESMPGKVMVQFGNADVRYAKNNAPDINTISPNWAATAWKGERVHTQLLISTKTPIKNLRI